MKQKTESIEPVRSCIGCRTRRPQSALVRITRSTSGITVDGPSSGRGAWVCRNQSEHTTDNVVRSLVDDQCLDTAVTKRAFARAWRSDVSASDVAAIRQHTGPDKAGREDTDTM